MIQIGNVRTSSPRKRPSREELPENRGPQRNRQRGPPFDRPRLSLLRPKPHRHGRHEEQVQPRVECEERFQIRLPPSKNPPSLNVNALTTFRSTSAKIFSPLLLGRLHCRCQHRSMVIHVLHFNCLSADESRKSASTCPAVHCWPEGSSESNEPKRCTCEPAQRISSDRMESNPVRTNLEPSESDCALTSQSSATRHTYLDIIDAAHLLRRPPCQVRRLADVGLVPAHALRHNGLTCWKFRLDELLTKLGG